ncbi:MAG: phosphoribosylformylglycinamidine synthase subunit PurQ [Actinomycetia bacterium]|nr:phosphoribosylformylglycinamidine synthase subunit PurQ [Actinomycetes bacterium]MCP4959532.1 phosphoribosylformylglycinamidine synthase subunit PurQ [Actinomycetes bacterium]
MSGVVRVLIPVALGTNRDADLAAAFEAAGAEADRVPLTALRSGEKKLADYQILAVPGGFSYGDALGAGRLLGLDMSGWFSEQLREAVSAEMPVFGVCNGFQALVRAGLLPGDGDAVLAHNMNHRFECRWVTLEADGANSSPWLAGLDEPIRCPVAHGEGRFVAGDIDTIEDRNGVALRYLGDDHLPAGGAYPANPNGSMNDIAGITDPSGLVIGLMPHPENHVFDRQDPLRGRFAGGNCLPLFKAGVDAVS